MHAAVITAYRDFPMLIALVRRLRDGGFVVFVHVDTRSRITDTELEQLGALGCEVSRRHAINWGSYSHLVAVNEMIAAALADPAVTYVHTLSGQDWPVRDPDGIRAECDGSIYMLSEPLAQTSEMVRERFEVRKLLHPIEHVRAIYRPLNKALFLAQKLLRLKRRRARAYPEIFKGLIWMSLPVDAARHVLEHPTAQSFLRELRSVYLPEEFFYQTVLEHSPYAASIRNDARRFVNWAEKHGAQPAILDLDDYDGIARSDDFFIRKIDSTISRSLVERLEAHSAPPAAR